MLVIAYAVAVFGFDVHVCSDTDHPYVEPLFAGISCEDIHPDVACHHHHCGCCEGCSEEHGGCEDTISCLSITGMDVEPVSIAPVFAVLPAMLQPVCADAQPARQCAFRLRSIKAPPRDCLISLCVLRA